MPQVSGVLNFTEGSIDVTDPCYAKHVWCRKTIAIEPGKYEYLATIRDNILWGRRVSRLRIVKQGTKGRLTFGEILSDEIGVDSAMAGFFENKPDYTSEQHDKIHSFIFDSAGYKSSKQRVFECHKDNPYLCEGVVCFSGMGDGCYVLVQLLDTCKNVVGYQLIFM